jgi:phospholipid/cholesterol/gamma-HCH transport system permease protein
MTVKPQLSPAALAGAIGRRTVQSLLYVVDLTVFVLHAMRGWGGHRGLLNRASYNAVIAQMIFTGIDALPAVTLLGLAVGAGITAQLIMLIQVVGTEADVINVLTRVVALELAPLLTAIIVIGRTGSAIAVDLGNMKLHREVEGLTLLGIDVQDFFISPRLVGVGLSQLILAVYFALIAVVSGVVFTALLLSFGYLKYLVAIPLAFDPVALIGFLFKNLLFGLIIGASACFHGLRVGVSPTEVPQQTQRAIVNSLVLVFLLDGMLAVALL